MMTSFYIICQVQRKKCHTHTHIVPVWFSRSRKPNDNSIIDKRLHVVNASLFLVNEYDGFLGFQLVFIPMSSFRPERPETINLFGRSGHFLNVSNHVVKIFLKFHLRQ